MWRSWLLKYMISDPCLRAVSPVEFSAHVQYLPWAESRPYVGGEYHCLVARARMRDTGHPHWLTENSVVTDEVRRAPSSEDQSHLVTIAELQVHLLPHLQTGHSCAPHLCTWFQILCGYHGVGIQVRGLCPDSMFNTAYTLTMTGAGRPRYLGHYTSSIQFDGDTQLWHWRDMRLGASLATRAVSRLFHVTI